MTGFVVIEGIDGCGKSTVARTVVRKIGKRAVLTREPTGSPIGRAVRKGEKRPISPYTDALLFMADRSQHTVRIRKLLSERKLIVSDRYYHSTVAYQAASLENVFEGDAFKWLLDANRKISLRPDLTVLIMIPPELGMKRISSRSKLSRYERLAFLKKVHANYLKLARRDRSVVKVDGTKPVDEVVGEVLKLIKEKKL